MNDSSPPKTTGRLWGIDVIAGIYGLAAILCAALCFSGSEIGRLSGLILTPVCLVLCLGIGFRVNIVRLGMLMLLAVSLVADGALIAYYAGALAGLFQCPPNKEPLEELLKMPYRFVATLAMFLYLKRSDVREAFLRRPANEADYRLPEIDADS